MSFEQRLRKEQEEIKELLASIVNIPHESKPDEEQPPSIEHDQEK